MPTHLCGHAHAEPPFEVPYSNMCTNKYDFFIVCCVIIVISLIAANLKPPENKTITDSQQQRGGAVYTRWGKSSCPEVEDTELLYSGVVGGTMFNLRGGGANYLCMPATEPEYSPELSYRPGVNEWVAKVVGSEYEGPLQGVHNHNVPCAVCYVSTRPTVVMIPAKASCPPTWTREYYGYIMVDTSTQQHNDHSRTMFECVDKEQESLPGGHADTNGALFYHAEADCTGLPCPPYNNHQELNCVVCTK